MRVIMVLAMVLLVISCSNRNEKAKDAVRADFKKYTDKTKSINELQWSEIDSVYYDKSALFEIDDYERDTRIVSKKEFIAKNDTIRAMRKRIKQKQNGMKPNREVIRLKYEIAENGKTISVLDRTFILDSTLTSVSECVYSELFYNDAKKDITDI